MLPIILSRNHINDIVASGKEIDLNGLKLRTNQKKFVQNWLTKKISITI